MDFRFFCPIFELQTFNTAFLGPYSDGGNLFWHGCNEFQFYGLYRFQPIDYLPYPYINPDYNSPLIYWWGYCNTQITIATSVDKGWIVIWINVGICLFPLMEPIKSGLQEPVMCESRHFKSEYLESESIPIFLNSNPNPTAPAGHTRPKEGSKANKK